MTYPYRHTEIYKDIRIDCKAKTRKELVAKVSKKKEQIDRQAIDSSTTLSDFSNAYLVAYKENTVSRSWYKDLEYLTRKLVDGVGDKPIGKIKPIEVQAFLNSCSKYSKSTVKKIYDITNQIFNHAMLNGATSYQFNLTVPKAKSKTSVGRSLTDDEIEALFHVIDGHRSELFISIMYHCGLRPSEVSALTWADVDMRKKVIHVTKAVKKDGSIGTPKSLAGVRDVPIPMKLLPMLQKAVRTKNKPVCDQRNGIHSKSSVRKMWQSVLRMMENELNRPVDCRLYDIRHTYCTNLEKKGVPINIASRLMGHSDISVTSKIYTHASDDTLELARRLIDS